MAGSYISLQGAIKPQVKTITACRSWIIVAYKLTGGDITIYYFDLIPPTTSIFEITKKVK